MDNINIDNNTMQNIKNLVDNGQISDAVSQISPEMIQQFSKMLNTNNHTIDNQFNKTQNSTNNINSNSKVNNSVPNNSSNSDNTNNSTNSNTFNLNNLDVNTIMKLSSALGKINNSQNDPRNNLLNSLKPYLRDSKKDKLEEYMKLLNVTKIAEVLNNSENKNPNNNT